MRVIPLGTSSGRPTAQRNVSALAVDLGRTWILVDCGEVTQHRIARSGLRPSRLAAVLLTHLHGDHVLGLPGLLGTLGIEGRTAPLPVVAPAGLDRWLEVMSELPILGLDFPVELTSLHDDEMAGAAGVPGPVLEAGGATVSTLPLRHRVPAFGYRIELPRRPGRVDASAAAAHGLSGGEIGRLVRGEPVDTATGRVVPSDVVGAERPGGVVTVLGDTTYCAASVDLARSADLLVHEATYVDADAEHAERWRHSTAGDAARVAAEAGARALVITHFSSRYASTDGLLADARAVFGATEAAVELAPIEVTLAD